MKWMWATAVIVAISAAVSAETGKVMNGSKAGNKMNMTFTGCVEAVQPGGSFVLTHVADSMMQNNSEMTKKDGTRTSKQMHAATMMSSGMVLTGGTDFRQHVGQKVTVTGSRSHGTSEAMPHGQDTLTVASLKVIAKSCP
jgi:hypothetical protein